MTQRTDVIIARHAYVGHVLVERQLLVNGDDNTSYHRHQWNDGIRNTHCSQVVDSDASTSGRELYYFRFCRVELETVDLQPRMNTGCAFLELTDVVGQVGSGHCDVNLRIVGVLVERTDDAGQRRDIQ